jgi:hypothetical protein
MRTLTWGLVLLAVGCSGFALAPTRPALRRSAAALRNAPLTASMTSLLQIAEGEADATNSAVALTTTLTDTLLDLAVYALLIGVAGLTVYSIYVTLDQSNKDYGGWTPRGDEDGPEQIQKGAVYDPSTDQWTYPTKPAKSAPKVGRAPASPDAEVANRYDRRAEKKRKKAAKKKKR